MNLLKLKKTNLMQQGSFLLLTMQPFFHFSLFRFGCSKNLETTCFDPAWVGRISHLRIVDRLNKHNCKMQSHLRIVISRQISTYYIILSFWSVVNKTQVSIRNLDKLKLPTKFQKTVKDKRLKWNDSYQGASVSRHSRSLGICLTTSKLDSVFRELEKEFIKGGENS